VFEVEGVPGRSLGLALIRDCNGARSFDTLLRYRGGTLAELWRALRTLKALQAEQAQTAQAAPAPRPLLAPQEMPIKPESPKNTRDSARPEDQAAPQADPGPAPAQLHRPLPTAGATSCALPFEPERREQPVKAAPPSLPTKSLERGDTAALLRAGTALATLGRRSWP
jgi:hypothetical protein